MFIPSLHNKNGHYYGQLIVLLNMTKYEKTQHGNLNNILARFLKKRNLSLGKLHPVDYLGAAGIQQC